MTDHDSLKHLIQTIAAERGLDLRGYKMSTLERRIRRRMAQVGVAEYEGYLEKVRSDPQETNELLNTVLINVTEFFRDPQAWEVLRTDILPRLLAGMKPGDVFRAWSAGCASGEEPYSLAILLADYLGPRHSDYDIKIYATDIDEEALNIARRGEYPSGHLRRMQPAWRERYFHGSSVLRLNREIRRMVIFGRSNLVADAPISHCQIVVCRNVLIYFDSATQKQIFARFHYALEPNGFLFLGKAESKLTESSIFRPVDSRWRIFQRVDRETKQTRVEDVFPVGGRGDDAQQELQTLRIQMKYLLQTLRSGIVTLDAHDVVDTCNESALAIWGMTGVRVIGRRIHNTDFALRCPEIQPRLEQSHSSNDPITFQCRLRPNGEERVLSVTLSPVMAENGERAGTIIYSEDITSQDRLQSTVEQLEATSEELQSANEELETTNEELQSTNEELETTNEELQSTNEELETTNEELHSLNEELENMNEELEARTRDLHFLTNRYAETLRRMPWPVLLVDREEKIQLWNVAAQKLFGVGATSVVGIEVDKLPMQQALRKVLVRKLRSVMENRHSVTMRHQELESAGFKGSFDIQLTAISRDDIETEGVLVMFGPAQAGKAANRNPKNNRNKNDKSEKNSKNKPKNKNNAKSRSSRAPN
jgi:two-component system CheB/CheR fusion protein